MDAEREKIAKEIEELERILDPSSSSIGVEVSESGLALDSEAGELSQAVAGLDSSALRLLSATDAADQWFLSQSGLCLYSP